MSMKKAIVLALAVMLTLSLAVPAAAVTSPVAPETSETTTAPLPEIVEIDVVVDVETETKTDDDTVIIVEPVTAEDADKLSEKAQTAYAAAQGQLAEAKLADMKTQYFFYVTIVKTDEERSFREVYDGAVNMTVKIANVKNVVVKQFVDGKWVELEAIINADGTVTIQGVVEGPIAIFTK